MPTISFPSSPSLNDTYTFGGKTWVYNGSAWDLQSSGAINGIVIGNVTPAAGTFTTISAANGIPTTTVANTAPANPEQGDIWIDSDTGTQLIYFTAGGNSQWAEMEAEQSFSTGSSEVDLTAVNTDILPTANITYDIGNTTNRFRDIYLANSTIYLGEAQISATDGAIVLPANSTVGGAVLVASPLITAIDYPGDDTAADPAGGQTISIEGANFQSGAAVYVDGGLVGVVSFISSSILQFVSPAKAAGSYSLYVVNPNGATAIAVPGIQYSGTPTWTTGAGSLGTPYETTAFNTTVVATGDVPITYSVAAGNSLPTDMTLTSANGYLSVATVPVTNNDTTYNFNLIATDAEQQDTPRQFSVTYKTDVVTWDSPANASSYTWSEGTANSVSMTATSAAGKAVSFAVQSGSLPSNVTIAGNLISGTPNVVQSNTSVVVRALAADTARYADQTFYFTVVSGNPDRGLFAGSETTTTIDYISLTTTGNATNFGNLPAMQQFGAGCASTTRGLFGGGAYSYSNVINYVTIASIGNALDFGDLTQGRNFLSACSSSTRGIWAGGFNGSSSSVIDYVTIATLGNALSFGSLDASRRQGIGCSSPTRGLFAGGTVDGQSNSTSITYITIASLGNSTTFGNMTIGRFLLSACASSTRALFAGGSGVNGLTNVIDYVTIASTGNATDFGDLTSAREQLLGVSSETRGIFGGGVTSVPVSTMDYVTIASLGNATNFGNLTRARSEMAGSCSSNHGGLQ